MYAHKRSLVNKIVLHSIIHINIPNSSQASKLAQPCLGVPSEALLGVGLAQLGVGVAQPGVGVA